MPVGIGNALNVGARTRRISFFCRRALEQPLYTTEGAHDTRTPEGKDILRFSTALREPEGDARGHLEWNYLPLNYGSSPGQATTEANHNNIIVGLDALVAL